MLCSSSNGIEMMENGDRQKCDSTEGRLKLDTDGSRKSERNGGFRRLIRDERGAWVCGYYGRLQPGTSLEVESWALYKGLTIILQKGLNNVIIETNVAQVVQLMEEEIGDKCPFKNLVEDAKILLGNALSNMFGRKEIFVLMPWQSLELNNLKT